MKDAIEKRSQQERITVVVRGDEWTKVSSFDQSGPNDNHYVLDRDVSGRRVVQFGDGKQGARPPDGDSLVVTYRIRKGYSGI